MFIKALELNGFKTFAKRQKLLFGPGINIIIGPNGSGKSNVVEAVL
ncbi:MAG TPA: hypothetical protein ENM97_02405 [Moorella mulderi]|nr:hypothetical protein [Moorella mulderi]